MTQEDKELLLKDLCARLPYGVIVDYKENEFEFPHWRITTIYPETMDGWIGYYKRIGAGSEIGSRPFNIGDVKPYLRPMSSMTEEEREDFYQNVLDMDIEDVRYENDGKLPLPYNQKDKFIWFEDIYLDNVFAVIDWLNAHHFDYRGLIERGLAIEVTEDNNPYKE